MIARASRVFPGVLVTMLLAFPAFAGTVPDAANTARVGHALEHRRPASNGGRYKAATKLATKATTAKATTAKAAPRLARGRRAAPVHTIAFVDDGFRYTESPTGEAAWKQSGVASWYGGGRWQGHRTSSGARYDENQLTAAHATLPLGSKVRVSLHNSARSVVVTITDRPGTRSRIIDLSRGAASALGILDQGVAMVTLSPG